MSWTRRLLNLFRSNHHAREIDRELAFHLTERADELVAGGMPRSLATAEARRRFGNYSMQKERTRDVDIVAWIDSCVSDIRYGVRALRHSPVFAFVAIASLALGIGANTAIFTLIDAVILRSLPVAHPEELLQITMIDGNPTFTNPVWEQIRDRQTMMSGMFAYSEKRFNLAPSGETRYAVGNMVSGDFFRALGVRPAFGRLLTTADDQRGCPAIAVVSDAFWRTEFGGDVHVLGKTVSLNTHPFQVVGVTEPSFTGLEVGHAAQFFIPICSDAVLRGRNNMLSHRSAWWLTIVGRPKAGLTQQQVASALATIAPGVYESTIPSNWRPEQQRSYLTRGLTVTEAGNGMSELRHRYKLALVVLMVIVGLVLVIACANVANLLLARAAGRQQEAAVRVALGAGRGRLVRQMLTESLLLSVAGTALGIVFARWGSRLLVTYLSTSGSTISLDLGLDYRVLGFTIGVAVLTGLAFGLAPAWRSANVAPNAALKANSRGVAGGRRRVTGGEALVVAQMAISLALVVGAGLLLGTFRKLATADPGFRAEDVLLVTLAQPSVGTGNDYFAVDQRAIERLASLPGVKSASYSDLTPLGNGMWNEELVIDGFAPQSEDDAISYFNRVSPGYFQTLGTPIIEGRDLSDDDRLGSRDVAVVNQTMARHFFKTSSPIGHTFRLRHGATLTSPIEIVGVVKDAKYQSLREETLATSYVSMAQDSTVSSTTTFELRVATGATSIIPAVKAALTEINPSFSLTFKALQTQVDESLARERLLATLSAFFGGLALLLATLGLYGVMSYNVARRRNEIGIRMALGAGQRRVTMMVLRQVGVTVGFGLAIGVALAVAMTRFISSFLFGLGPTDRATFAGGMFALASVALLAAYLPARRASRVDPMEALREQ